MTCSSAIPTFIKTYAKWLANDSSRFFNSKSFFISFFHQNRDAKRYFSPRLKHFLDQVDDAQAAQEQKDRAEGAASDTS